MIRHSFSVALILALVVLTLIPLWQSARACSCPLIEPDVAYQQAFLIFTGKVEKVTELTREVVQDGKPFLSSEGRVAHFTVEEYFKGGGGPEIDLRGGNTSCDINFEGGKRYIIYASQNAQTGALGAFSCSRTQPLSDYTKADISYLRRVTRGERPTMLYGFAFKNTADTAKRGEPEPLGDLMVTVEGDGERLELKTDASGYFETYNLPPGSYHVRTGVTGKLRGAEEKTVELKSSSVASMIFRTTTMGSLNGRVIDQEGQPVGEIMVELSFPGSTLGVRTIPNYETTDEDGRFNFREVLAGRYVLAVNPRGRRSLYGAPFFPSYYPNAATSAEAQVITVIDGLAVEMDNFVLQKRYPTIAVNGMVITSDGKPIPGAYVYLDQSGGEWDTARAVQTDADGHFVQQAYEGVIYKLRAIADGPTGVAMESDRVEVVAVKNMAPVRLVVKISK